MDLPFRIQSEAGDEPVLSVDGAFGAPGLNLSHWPGNATPADLRHDLSTGIALAFARLDADERARRAAGCVAVANNHYDTDGVLAAFAVLHPEAALPRERAMLDAAAAGDLFRCPTELAFQIDRIVTEIASEDRFPGLDDRARWEAATRALFELLPRLLDGDVESERELWHGALERLREDRARIEAASLDDLVHLDAAVFAAPPGDPGDAFDPGRHAFFERVHADRVLLLGPLDGGTSARFVLSTKSFFDLATQRTQPRPDLVALAARLNELEGTAPGEEAGAELAWRHQSPSGASPELWFGRAGLALYAEHAGDFLGASRLDPLAIKREVLESLRKVFVFPDDDEDD